MWRNMLAAISCRATFWLRGSDREVYRVEHEVIDLILDDDDE